MTPTPSDNGRTQQEAPWQAALANFDTGCREELMHLLSMHPEAQAASSLLEGVTQAMLLECEQWIQTLEQHSTLSLLLPGARFLNISLCSTHPPYAHGFSSCTASSAALLDAADAPMVFADKDALLHVFKEITGLLTLEHHHLRGEGPVS